MDASEDEGLEEFQIDVAPGGSDSDEAVNAVDESSDSQAFTDDEPTMIAQKAQVKKKAG